MRAVLRLAAVAATLVALVPFHYLWRLFGLDSPWPRRFLGHAARIAGMRVVSNGVPLRSNVLFVANHSSWLDILILAGASGATFVSKAEVGRWPLVGWLAGLNRTIYVARQARGEVRGQADLLRAALARGQPVALFPEGTTDGGNEVLPFRPSLLASLFPPMPNLKIQPVAIDYGPAGAELAWVGTETAIDNARRVLSRRTPTVVTLTFLDPIDPAGAGDRKVIAAEAHAAIVAAFDARRDPL